MLPIALCNRGGEVGLQDEGLARHFAVSGYAFQREAVLRERKCLIWLAIALHDFVQPRHHPAHDCSPVARAAIRAAASVSPSYSSALSVSALRREIGRASCRERVCQYV